MKTVSIIHLKMATMRLFEITDINQTYIILSNAKLSFKKNLI